MPLNQFKIGVNGKAKGTAQAPKFYQNLRIEGKTSVPNPNRGPARGARCVGEPVRAKSGGRLMSALGQKET